MIKQSGHFRLAANKDSTFRLESPGYEGHSLSMLRRVAEALDAHVRVTFEPQKKGNEMRVAEESAVYDSKRSKAKKR